MPDKAVNRKSLMVNSLVKQTMNDTRFTKNKPTISLGFTLIELLVVIAIIGILSAMATLAYTDSQQKSRDTRRKSDLEAIKKALELAKQDTAGAYSYPRCRTYTSGACPLTADGTGPADGPTSADLIGTNYSYIKSIPQDPKTGSYTYIPIPASCDNGSTICTGFQITACLENKKDQGKDPTDTCSGDTVSYTISNL